MKRLPFFFLLLSVFLSSVTPLTAALFQRARISQIVNKVTVLKPTKPPQPAQVNEKISGETAVRTGVSSRSELVFPDDTVTRLGSNTFFSFRQGSRDMYMQHGVMLLQAPKGAGGAKITTGAVTAAITGTTIIWEVPPPGTPPEQQYTKLICIEAYKDGVRFYFNDRPLDSIIVPPGHMIIVPPGAKSLLDVEPVPINIKRLLRSSLLINGLSMDGRVTPFTLSAFGPVISDQEIQFSRNELLPTNLVIDGIGTSVLIATDYRANADKTFALNRARRAIPVASTPTPTPTPSPMATPTATPTGTPSKFGRPPLIADPDPYIIFDSTVVQTDPSITTNGVTDFGKIYRNQAVDGLFTNFVFGSTTEIDSLADLNEGRNNTAVYKFSNLILAGSPIFNTKGGPTKVFFAALNNIDSGGSGSATLNLSGLTELGLIASGNITLDSRVNFITTDDVSRNLIIAARGASSDLSLANTIKGSNLGVDLVASVDILMDAFIEAADVRLFAGKDVSLGDTIISADVLNINAGNDITFFPIDLASGTGTSIGAPLLNLVAGGNIAINAENFVFQEGYIFNVTANTIEAASDFVFNETGFPQVIASLTAGPGGIEANSFDLIGFENITSEGDVTVGNLAVQNLTARDVSASLVTPNDITKLHTFSVQSLEAPSGLLFEGGPGQNGGHLELNIDSVQFSTAAVAPPPVIGGANFTGGLNGGDGGSLIVNASNNVTVSAPIIATTGILAAPSPSPAGRGGTVEFNSASGQITVDSMVQVSSDGFRGSAAVSAQGGNIAVTSGRTNPNQVAINITNSAQLYSLLSGASPGPGGTINIQSTGGQIVIGEADIEATRGTVDIRNNGGMGTIAINGTQIAADVVKIGALGANGVLNIQSGSNISADRLMKLYGGLSNGEVRFSGEGTVNLNAGNQIDIAAKTVTIEPSVSVDNNAPQTRVSSDNRNYNDEGFGSFIGEGGFTEQPASAAPPF